LLRNLEMYYCLRCPTMNLSGDEELTWFNQN
jgi:hypothetical protein